MAKRRGVWPLIAAKCRGYLTVYNGVDYSAVYDYNYYINQYPDLKKAYAWNEYELLQHFVACGMAEGRQASANFNVNYYKANNPDLRSLYGNNLRTITCTISVPAKPRAGWLIGCWIRVTTALVPADPERPRLITPS